MAMELDSSILNDKLSLFWNNISDILSSSIPNTLPILIAFSWKSARRILRLTIMSAMAQEESKHISERV